MRAMLQARSLLVEGNMKRLIAAILIVGGATVTTMPAVAASVVFQGSLILESVSTKCQLLPYIEQTNVFRMSFRPAGVGTNGTATKFILSAPDVLVASYRLDNGSLNFEFQVLSVAEIVWLGDDLGDVTYLPSVKLNNLTPQIIAETTRFVTMRGQIRGFGGQAGCRVGFRAALART